MTGIVSLELTGVPEVDRKLEGLAERTGQKIGRQAINAGLAELRKEQRKRAPVGKTKALKKGIGSRFRKNKRKHLMEALAGINVGRKQNTASYAPHGHLVVLGTTKRTARPNKSSTVRANRGHMIANDFIADGTRAALPRVKPAMIAKADKALEKELAKHGVG